MPSLATVVRYVVAAIKKQAIVVSEPRLPPLQGLGNTNRDSDLEGPLAHETCGSPALPRDAQAPGFMVLPRVLTGRTFHKEHQELLGAGEQMCSVMFYPYPAADTPRTAGSTALFEAAAATFIHPQCPTSCPGSINHRRIFFLNSFHPNQPLWVDGFAKSRHQNN